MSEIIINTPTSSSPADQPLRFSVFFGCLDNDPKHFQMTWADLDSEEGLRRIYCRSGSTREEAKHSLPAISPAAYQEGDLRGDRQVQSIQLFMLDFDNKAEQPTGETKPTGEPIFTKVPIPGAPTLQEVHEHLCGLGVTHLGYTSISSSPQCERYRIIIPLSQPSDGRNWKVVSECLLDQLQMEDWRSAGCIDLGAMHRAACIYFLPGYWADEPEAKDRIQFVSHEGRFLDLPSPESIELKTVPPGAVHPQRKAWIDQRNAQRSASISGDPKDWFKDFNVDFPTLDPVGLLRDMGSEVQTPTSHGSGQKARCTCPFASEHTGGLDHGDAAVFFEPGKWPGFHCMHAGHEGVGLREICLEAGPELVQRHAKPYGLVKPAKHRIQANQDDASSGVLEGEVIDDSEEGKAKRERQHWTEVLLEHEVDPGRIMFSGRGRIEKCRSNLEVILEAASELSGNFRLNEMTNTVEASIPGREYLALDDLSRCLTAIQIHLELTYGNSWAEDAVTKVTELVAGKHAYHPVIEYLKGLPPWDGQDRFPLVVESVLGANSTPEFETYRDLYLEYMRCTCVGALRRVFEPGCKMDTATILYGDQAALKSTFWKTLAVDPTWFNDSKVQIENPEGMKVLHHAWIHELGEIDDMTSMKSAEVIKAFLSSDTDTFRESYGKGPKAHKRRCIIVGSTNKEQVLNDPTGSRRFWVIPVGTRCDLGLLRSNLDQIWAQAHHLYQAGSPHYLTAEFEAKRIAQSGRHQVENRYADLLPKILGFYLTAPRPKGITLNEIFSFLEGKIEEGKGFAKPNNADRRDLGACLRAAGWTTKSAWVDGASSKCFTPPGDQLLHPAPPMMGFPIPPLDSGPFSDQALGEGRKPFQDPDRPILL